MKYDFPYEVNLKFDKWNLISMRKTYLKRILTEIVMMISHSNCMYMIQVRWWILFGKDI
jgi:hypothetical protein